METQAKTGTQTEMRRGGSFLNKLFKYLFYIHFLPIIVLVVFLILRGVFFTPRFHPDKWYLPVLASTACAGIIGFAWQAFTGYDPSKAIKAAFWLSPLLTCGYAILLISIGTPGGLAASVIALVSSILQSIYACWVSSRFEHANRIVILSIMYRPPKVKAAVIMSIMICTLYSSLLISGVGGATAGRTKIDALFIFLILGSFIWTMQIVKNMMLVAVSHVKYMQFASATEVEFSKVVKDAAKYSMGTICIGSVLVPVLGVIRGLARGVSLLSGDVDEFMFSCTSCCLGIASRIVEYGNRWGFLHVGVYKKGIVQASMDTWEMFRRAGMEKAINSDLTSSFCFMCGVASGSICALVAGSWALIIQKNYAIEVSIYTFLIGYYMSRISMSWVQGSVTAYYVAYAENPQGQQFDTTIPAYIRKLERTQV